MTFAFARVNRTGADNSEGFSTFDKAHNEQPTLARITDDHLAMFVDGVFRIILDAGDIVVEHRLRLGESDSVLAKIAALLGGIPVESRRSNHDSSASMVRLPLPVNSGIGGGGMLSKDIGSGARCGIVPGRSIENPKTT
jgi:hypothetical protein